MGLSLVTFGQVTGTGAAKAIGLPSVKIMSITIDALNANTGDVFIGDSTVASGVGQRIAKGTSITLSSLGSTHALTPDNLFMFSTTGDKISVNYLKVLNG